MKQKNNFFFLAKTHIYTQEHKIKDMQ